MNEQTSDQGWEQLQNHITGFLGQSLRNHAQRSEYKPLFIVPMLEMTSERHQNERQIATTTSDNFRQKGEGR